MLAIRTVLISPLSLFFSGSGKIGCGAKEEVQEKGMVLGGVRRVGAEPGHINIEGVPSKMMAEVG